MDNYFTRNQTELLATAVTIALFIILKLIITKVVKKTGESSKFIEIRTKLVNKYITIILYIIVIGILTFIWGVNFKEIGLLFSSIFAVIGIALFAQWSILSNLTAGVILFFAFPFKIGDKVRILDNDINSETIYLIEDIKAFHVSLRKESGELLVYPNSLLMQKAVALIN